MCIVLGHSRDGLRIIYVIRSPRKKRWQAASTIIPTHQILLRNWLQGGRGARRTLVGVNGRLFSSIEGQARDSMRKICFDLIDRCFKRGNLTFDFGPIAIFELAKK